jgi:hypothetical protein
MAPKGNKSAGATTPLRRFASDSWRVIQIGSNWHGIPVRAPLTNTENEKNDNSEEFEWRALFKKRAGLPEPNFGSKAGPYGQ